MSHREWDGGEDRMGEKGGGSQTSVTGAGGIAGGAPGFNLHEWEMEGYLGKEKACEVVE